MPYYTLSAVRTLWGGAREIHGDSVGYRGTTHPSPNLRLTALPSPSSCSRSIACLLPPVSFAAPVIALQSASAPLRAIRFAAPLARYRALAHRQFVPPGPPPAPLADASPASSPAGCRLSSGSPCAARLLPRSPHSWRSPLPTTCQAFLGAAQRKILTNRRPKTLFS